jgi:hypothetical protein
MPATPPVVDRVTSPTCDATLDVVGAEVAEGADVGEFVDGLSVVVALEPLS